MNVNEAIDVAQHWNFFLWKCAAFLAACGAQPEDARQSLQYALLPFQVDIPNAQYASSVKSQHLHGRTPITRASQRVHSIMVESIVMLAILCMLNSWNWAQIGSAEMALMLVLLHENHSHVSGANRNVTL